jgi:uncharacterized protein (UPF0210 family)
MSLKLQNQQTFARHIERTVREKELTYIEAVVEYINETGIEFKKVNKLIGKTLRDKIEKEALDLNMFPTKKKDSNTLLFDE